MSSELFVTLDNDQKARIDAIAEARQETTAEILGEAVAHYLDYDAWFRREVDKGLASLARGEGHDLEDVAASFRQRIADLKRRED
jgi:predicted transcriptional regulator